jgi:hypothetical protein
VVEVENIQLGSNDGVIQLQIEIGKISNRGGKLQFDYTSCKNGVKCKRLRI